MAAPSPVSVKLFKRALLAFAVAPSILATVLPVELWTHVAWLLKDLTLIGVAGYGCTEIDYKRLEAKLTAFVIALWRVVVLLINVAVDVSPQDLGEDPQWLAIGILGALTASMYTVLHRAKSLTDIKSSPLNDTDAFYVLIPVHDKWGLWQCILFPWHYGRYQSRAVVQACDCWHVKKRAYARNADTSTASLIRTHPNAAIISLGRELTKEERVTLSDMEGKPVTMGVRDCRQLMVAGHPRKFVR